MKLCECGCGHPAPIAKKTQTSRGWVKGLPVKYRRGHAWIARCKRLGVPLSENPRTRRVGDPVVPRKPARVRRTRRSVDDRFWSKVRVGVDSACWPWMASVRANGYGQFFYSGTMAKAHRVAWMLVRGDIPAGLFVCHSCDNPLCCNPSHLFLGTNADNVADMMRKGRNRQPRGEAHFAVKLTESQAREIIARCRGGEMKRRVAETYGVSESHVCAIVAGAKWRHLATAHVSAR